MNRAGLIGYKHHMLSLEEIMSTTGVVELCGPVDPGVDYDKATCIAERYADLLGVEIDAVC